MSATGQPKLADWLNFAMGVGNSSSSTYNMLCIHISSCDGESCVWCIESISEHIFQSPARCCSLSYAVPVRRCWRPSVDSPVSRPFFIWRPQPFPCLPRGLLAPSPHLSNAARMLCLCGKSFSYLLDQQHQGVRHHCGKSLVVSNDFVG